MFSAILVFAAISGISGGYMFAKIEQSLPEGWTKFFNSASIVMLAQDVLTNAACLVLMQAMGVSLEPIGGPVLVGLFFFAVVFISPACGFLWAKNSC